MRILLISMLVLMSSTVYAKVKPHCNQIVYDAIYRAALTKALSKPELSSSDMAQRNQVIRVLRELCFEQRSTFELKNPIGPNLIKNRIKELPYEPDKS